MNLYEIAIALDVSAYAILSWVEEGCPRNGDLFSIAQVRVWRQNRDAVLQAAAEGRDPRTLTLTPLPPFEQAGADAGAPKLSLVVERFSTRKAAEFLGIEVVELHRWRQEGCPEPVRSGLRWMWDVAAVARWKGVPIPDTRKKRKRKRTDIKGVPVQVIPDGLMTTTQVAQHFGVSDTTVRTWVSKGCPAAYRSAAPPETSLFRLDEVEEWKKDRAGNWRMFLAQTLKEQAATGYLTCDQVGEALGVSGGRIGEWIRVGCPVAIRGRRGKSHLLDLEAVRAWREERQQKKAA